MKAIRRILSELFGLFVDDWRIALLLLVWFVLARLVLTRLPVAPGWRSVIFAGGILLLLALSVVRDAARARSKVKPAAR